MGATKINHKVVKTLPKNPIKRFEPFIESIYMNDKRKKVMLLYSGGLDSKLSLIVLSKYIKNINLVFIDPGYLKNSHLVFEDAFLEQIIKETNISLTTFRIDAFPLFEEALLRRIPNIFRTYQENNPVCAICKLTMYTLTARLAIMEKIKVIADGSTLRQENFSEQSKKVVSWLDKYLVNDYNISLLHPVYFFLNKREIKDILISYGVSQNPYEPYCLFSYIPQPTKDESKFVIDIMEREKGTIKKMVDEYLLSELGGKI
jgi:tRNA(Ile)-lysidine synthase TilS/MesJ